MSDTYDAIIIGAGVIGGAIAHELAGRGWRTLTVDKAATAGSGSTINSCAIVRFSYSSVEGINLAWEGMHYWKDWPAYIGTDDELANGAARGTGERECRRGRRGEAWSWRPGGFG